METVIDTADVKQKLETIQLGEYYFNEFCRVLAKRLNPEITPLGFLMAVSLLKVDAAKGDGVYIRGVGEPIQSRLSSVDVGIFIELHFKKIVEHAFPADFATKILEERDAVLAEAKAYEAKSPEDKLKALLGL